jgi:large subunit ribosomal protein L18
MGVTSKKLLSRKKRQARVRRQIQGTGAQPRLCVFRSLKYTYAQLISDETSSVLASASTKSIVVDGSRGGKVGAKALGAEIAKLAKEKNIKKVVFDRNGYLYHGRIAAVAEGAREAGLEF